MLGGIFVVLVSFFVYLRTICPSVYVGDAGELISAVYNLGIPHPPGYPLFCIIGKLLHLFHWVILLLELIL